MSGKKIAFDYISFQSRLQSYAIKSPVLAHAQTGDQMKATVMMIGELRMTNVTPNEGRGQS